jgi:hypothetical protein
MINLPRLFAFLVGCSSMALMATSGHADTYRWVDDNGVVNYSERVPRGIPAERVTKVAESSAKHQAARASTATGTKSTAPLPGASTSQSAQQPLNEDQQNLLEGLQAAEQQRQEQIAKIRQDNCERSRRVLNNLSVRSRIRVRAEDGTERVLNEEERQERIADAQRGIAENCEA